MPHKLNSRQLVLRRDTATGLTHVGWESDLPLVRFEHLALIGELAKNSLPDCNSEYYTAYQSALRQACEANHVLLEQQACQNRARGWYRVPFDLAQDRQAMRADSIGNYAAAAMQLHYQLTHHCQLAWGILLHDKIVHVRARYPKKTLDELTYQVWYHKQLHDLNELHGSLMEGPLFVCESGLWFAARHVQDKH